MQYPVQFVHAMGSGGGGGVGGGGGEGGGHPRNN